uniref:Uncharacterized protein n=1 Tax=Avena sativa TaxID=4498 RepID=A0ACD5VNM5_AVESA
MARASYARDFLSAVEVAHAAAVALLCTGLTCACASPAPPPAEGAAPVVVAGVDNLSPSEFLASLRRAALDAPAVGLVGRARLKSWTLALAQGWGPAGAGHYPRRSLQELVDKIDLDDLNEPAGDAAADEDDSDKPLERPHKTPARAKRRGRPRKEEASLTEEEEEEEEDAGEEIDHKGENLVSPVATELSTGRKRKKSKYLSPPYTNLGGYALEDKIDKSADLPAESVTSSSKGEKKASQDNVDVGEVLELVRSFGEDVFHETKFPKAADRFLGSFRSSTFADVDVARLISDPGAALKLGKCVLERSRKKDEVGVGASSSIKRKKKTEKTSPTATLDFPAENVVAKDSVDVVATLDFPTENVVAKDSVDVAALGSDSGAALETVKGEMKRGRKKKDQDGSGASSIKRKKAEKTSPKATPDLPAEIVSANASADGTILVPHSCDTVEQGKGVMKRGRKKKDQDGSGGSPIKRKKMKKISPTPTLDSGLVITPAIPIRQLRAEDLLSRVTSGGGAGMGAVVLDQNKLESTSLVTAAMSGGMKSGEEQDQADGGSVVKTPVTGEATKLGTHPNVESVITDLPAKSVQAEETKPGMGIQVDMNVQSDVVDVPIRSVHMGGMELETNIPVDTNEHGVVTHLPVRSGLLPKDGGISQPADGNTNIANIEVSTVQGVVADVAVRSGLLPQQGGISQREDANTSIANLEAMVPEMYKKVDGITTGTNVTAMGHAFKAVDRNGEQTSQEKTALANHAPTISTNGTYSDAHSTPKRKNKKAPLPFANPAPQYFANPAPQHFANPAPQPFANPAPQPFANPAPQYFANPVEIVLQFADGVILPSKEELLAAFSKFGVLIESLSDILEDIRGARVVFGKSAEADAVYAKRETPGIFGQFGPPFATLELLNYLPPFTPSIPPPPPALKPLLGVDDMRKNVETMMLSLGEQKAAAASSGGTNPVPGYLYAEMQQLLAKLDKVQPGPSSSGSTPQ